MSSCVDVVIPQFRFSAHGSEGDGGVAEPVEMGAAAACCKERAEIVDEGTLLETHIAPRAVTIYTT